MSAKRAAPYSIDEKTLEDADNNNSAPRPEDKLPSQRTVFSVKKDEKEVDNNEKGQKTQDNKSEQNVAAKPEEKKEEKGLMFANLFKNNTNGVGIFSSGGLFGNVNLTSKVEPPKINYSSSSLFTGNGFSAAPAAPLTGSLFSNVSSNSIFGFGLGASVPPVKNNGNNGGEDEEGDSAELQQGQELKTDRSKSSGHYKYEEEAKVLANGHVKKYKKNNGDLVENVDAILQYDEKAKVHVLVIRLSATKNSIFTGLILHGKSEVRNINGKNENIEVSAFTVKKGKPVEKDRLKLQFETADEGSAFMGKIQEAIKAEPAKTE